MDSIPATKVARKVVNIVTLPTNAKHKCNARYIEISSHTRLEIMSPVPAMWSYIWPLEEPFGLLKEEYWSSVCNKAKISMLLFIPRRLRKFVVPCIKNVQGMNSHPATGQGTVPHFSCLRGEVSEEQLGTSFPSTLQSGPSLLGVRSVRVCKGLDEIPAQCDL
ncbi:hypothetical protein Cfor_06212 [Coptotermes formosanus]|uniref:Uncharacterized protein n=1 Tax=Coptotermes formosanus TaxID=36987 RepID=A0A6L2Q1I5_COPFO|nr:hypothetical protein Cfor_06212 [Coptotermes formosanus]